MNDRRPDKMPIHGWLPAHMAASLRLAEHACCPGSGEVTGVEKIHAVIGGFHLTGPEFSHVIQPTIDALKQINPDYVVPTHCTGRKAIADFERAMPNQFILNMSGTKLIFS